MLGKTSTEVRAEEDLPFCSLSQIREAGEADASLMVRKIVENIGEFAGVREENTISPCERLVQFAKVE